MQVTTHQQETITIQNNKSKFNTKLYITFFSDFQLLIPNSQVIKSCCPVLTKANIKKRLVKKTKLLLKTDPVLGYEKPLNSKVGIAFTVSF